MIAKAKKIELTIEELSTLLTGKTDNGKVDTIPEIIEEFERGVAPTDMQPISQEILDLILI